MTHLKVIDCAALDKGDEDLPHVDKALAELTPLMARVSAEHAEDPMDTVMVIGVRRGSEPSVFFPGDAKEHEQSIYFALSVLQHAIMRNDLFPDE